LRRTKNYAKFLGHPDVISAYVTVTLANNRDNKHVVSCCYFFKCVVTEVVLFSIVAFMTLTFHKVV